MQNLSQPSWIDRKAEPAHALRRRQMIELALGREVGVEHARTRQALAGAPYGGLALGFGQKLGQAVVGLRADDDVDGGLAAHDLLALGLGDAARDGDGEIAAFGAALALGIAQAAELGIDLLEACSRMWQVFSTTRSACSGVSAMA